MADIIFDASDVDYLVNYLNHVQLIKEIHDHDEWDDYIKACQLALDIQKTLEPEVLTSIDGTKTFESIESIKSRYDITEYVGQYIKLKKSGTNYSGICPFHSEKKGSFFVYSKSQTWHCFGACNKGGDIIGFVMAYHRVDIKTALQMLSTK